MKNKIYRINKGINRPLEFRGLKAQYIGYLAGGLVATLLLFSILYVSGVNSYLTVVIGFSLGSLVFFIVYRMNHKYGPNGFMQTRAKRNVPSVIKTKSRKYLFDK